MTAQRISQEMAVDAHFGGHKITLHHIIRHFSLLKYTVAFLMAPENGRVGESRESRRGTGSGGDCFIMFKTVGVSRRESCHCWMKA